MRFRFGNAPKRTLDGIKLGILGNIELSILTYFHVAASLPYLDAPRPGTTAGAGAAAGAANSAGIGKLPS